MQHLCSMPGLTRRLAGTCPSLIDINLRTRAHDLQHEADKDLLNLAEEKKSDRKRECETASLPDGRSSGDWRSSERRALGGEGCLPTGLPNSSCKT